jgi:hypothetical protein
MTELPDSAVSKEQSQWEFFENMRDENRDSPRARHLTLQAHILLRKWEQDERKKKYAEEHSSDEAAQLWYQKTFKKRVLKKQLARDEGTQTMTVMDRLGADVRGDDDSVVKDSEQTSVYEHQKYDHDSGDRRGVDSHAVKKAGRGEEMARKSLREKRREKRREDYASHDDDARVGSRTHDGRHVRTESKKEDKHEENAPGDARKVSDESSPVSLVEDPAKLGSTSSGEACMREVEKENEVIGEMCVCVCLCVCRTGKVCMEEVEKENEVIGEMCVYVCTCNGDACMKEVEKENEVIGGSFVCVCVCVCSCIRVHRL